MKNILILAFVVTEAGLASVATQVMKDLYELLSGLKETWTGTYKLCIVNTDNIPNNGDVLREHMMKWLLESPRSALSIGTYSLSRHHGEFS